MKNVHDPKAQRGPTPLRGWGWKDWVVPIADLHVVIEQAIPQLRQDYGHISRSIDEGEVNSAMIHNDSEWLGILSERVGMKLGCKPESAYRRINNVMAGRGKVVRAEFAEAVCISIGKHIDNDTEIATLPGNILLAIELIGRRADEANVIVSPKEVKTLAYKTLRLSRLVTDYPHHRERLLDLAPFDCLRPYR